MSLFPPRFGLPGAASPGKAAGADLRAGDVVEAVAGEPVADLADFFRSVWALGEAGVRVPLTIRRTASRFASCPETKTFPARPAFSSALMAPPAVTSFDATTATT